ncbi:hypothetical protein N781_08945 [Pontibacillus halophilus JSM 076056 = DSM 19796]|uniref:Uncharacterized protein n=1 Tax=Pontibacillus halophilus JSM 076056 = DSM 19796 TaxID=1385510 RepID=A0A0A5GCS2_9BACI|nr:DUF1672 family protein [Pontibacillus halophilus]KGX89834.1 hypothetical protein N781_08945 [Pontibacillus halophilus JSM 076056 = DSM 19796]
MNEKSENQETNANEADQNYENENLVPVQDYDGTGYTLRNASADIEKIAEENEEEIKEAVVQYFSNKYKSEVKVHNMEAANGGITVFLKSVSPLEYHTYAIVPVNEENASIMYEDIFTQSGQVENAIVTGIYAKVYNQEFNTLNSMLNQLAQEQPIVGVTADALNNVTGDGYSTQYYRTAIFDKNLIEVSNTFLKDPTLDAEEYKILLNDVDYDPNLLSYVIEFYMEDKDKKPKQEILDKIATEIEENKNELPPGSYELILNDNYINKVTAIGTNDNSLEIADPNSIIIKLKEE